VHVEPFTATWPDCGEAEYPPDGGMTVNPYDPVGMFVKMIAVIEFPAELEDSVCPSNVTLQTKPGLLVDKPCSENTTVYLGGAPQGEL